MSHQPLDEIFAKTLSDEYDSDSAWDAVRTLQTLGSREVLEQAVAWCNSTEPVKRARGADILAQIGKTADHPINGFPNESFAAVSDMLARETESQPHASAIYALGHIGDPRAVGLVVPHCSDPDANIRYAVACALGSFVDDPVAGTVLIQLMGDQDADVRDWATFGVGVLGREDSPEIRDALAARLGDPCDDAREEAMIGLAKRRDQRVLGPLIASLRAAPVPDRVMEAAFEMLGLQDEEGEGWTAIEYIAALQKKFEIQPVSD